jgi:hypothetical protein
VVIAAASKGGSCMIDYRAATLRKRRQRVRDRCGMAMS